MVNEDRADAKKIILAALREADGPVSGERLGARLGMSRVGIYKHIQSLKEAGYRILAGREGYRIEEYDSLPFSTWEFDSAERVEVMEQVASTMDEAHRRAAADPDSGDDFVLAAHTQKKGRGRLGREWDSPRGGLWVTRVIHPSAACTFDFQRYVMAGAAALARCLRERMGLGATVRWPNDVLIGGRKAAGVLGEGRVYGDRLVYLALGMGLNVNNQPGCGGVALRELTGREEDRRNLLREWLSAQDSLTASRAFRERQNPRWWNALMEGVGRRVEVWAGGVRRSGTVLGADGLGRLAIRRRSGSDIRIPAGDVDSGVVVRINQSPRQGNHPI